MMSYVLLGSGVGSGLGFLGAGLGAGLVIIGAGYGIGRLAAAALDGTARQPEAAGNLRTSMIIPAALIEGIAFFALIICFLMGDKVIVHSKIQKDNGTAAIHGEANPGQVAGTDVER